MIQPERHDMQIRILGAAALTAGALVLTACGSNTTPAAQSPSIGMGGMSMSTAAPQAAAAPASGPHNAADVSFATEMIPHHGQAIEMADMALKQATNADVKAMAQTIKDAQDPEVIRMSGWLKGWGAPVPSASMSSSSMAGMDHGQGMMSDADMASLGKAAGAAFDRMWVQLMIQHHEGAVTMAKTELAQGQNSDAKQLAQSIITSQSAQIDQLKAMLGKL
ncbi:DUF305 domain-containing protein [Jatrophihabitans telluris]|uniref:DUF305 domain-containing protein n=1 Tax=Jatrophihabitans telluris TaxID=2038343 RepID=A0ABY4QZ74_9ACTN|nr:DUF305 domain-containing protein [Jatrophihabitans telluris]UQX88823.1 DUF305 domain-containing protein [Jatrophihabitans telluris]